MSGRFEFPKNLPNYIKRLEVEYSRCELTDLANVLRNSKAEMRLEVSYDNWNGGQFGHDVVFYVPDEFMGLIPLDVQHDIQTRIARDLNRASSSIIDEHIENVHFELEVETGHADISADDQAIKRLWKLNTLKLFISHRDIDKKEVHELARYLNRYGISSFVAHDSIEPDEEWQKEIEKALQSMDVMLTFITDRFFESAWTNQEIGFAMGKGTPIVSLKLEDQDPVGFIKDRQAIRGDIRDVMNSGSKIYEAIRKRLKNSIHWRNLVVSRFCNATSFEDAKNSSEDLYEITDLSNAEIDRIVDVFNSNSQLNGCWNLIRGTKFIDFVNASSSTRMKMKNDKLIVDHNIDDGIPF